MIRTLSFQRAYACRHSGACCNAGWVDPDPHGRCRSYDAHPQGGCAIHRTQGHAALPHACQQFPRVATRSPLGTSVTLSAFCPTAASLLLEDGPFEIVTMHDTRAYEGMDARGVMPPLLRDGMLMDWEAVARWEELAVATLSRHRTDIDRALRIIERASLKVAETWTPGNEPLADALTCAFREPIEPIEPIEPAEPSIARFFASHAFACWPMYDGRGIRGALDWLVKARTALEEERRSGVDLKAAFRQADFRLRHSIF